MQRQRNTNAAAATPNKRQHTPHFIAGFGDGHHVNDPALLARVTDTTKYIRGRKRRHVPFNNNYKNRPTPSQQFRREEDLLLKMEELDAAAARTRPVLPRRPPVVVNAEQHWQYSAMFLIAMMGLLVALFLHLLGDSSSSDQHKKPLHRATAARRRPITTKKKKTDEWSDNDYETDDYNNNTNNHYASAGDESAPNSQKFYSFPRQRKIPANNAAAAATNRNPYHDAQSLASSATYKSPSNSYYQQQQQQQQQQQSLTPRRRIKATHLSPVSSFASTHDSVNDGDDEDDDEELLTPSSRAQVLPLPPGVTRGERSVTSSRSSSRQQHPVYSPAAFDEITPKAGKLAMANRLALQQPVASQDKAAAASSDKNDQVAVPFMPSLVSRGAPNAAATNNNTEDLALAMESGNIHHESDSRRALENSLYQRQQQESTILVAAESQDESDGDADPRKNIIHKRINLTHSTDTSSSLLSSIKFDELQLQEVIGGGGFGQVWRANWRGTPVAVKVLTGSAQRENVSRAILQEFAAEINMLKGMRHPNICLYMGACLDPPHRAIVTELAAIGSLWDALRLPLQAPFVAADGVSHTAWPVELYDGNNVLSPPFAPKGSWPWVLVKRVACGAARGMTYLHGGSPPVLHRDLKSANLLLDESYTAKVCDFGLSRLKEQQERSMTGNTGTVQWMSPEILANKPYAEPSDVYSFGIILWELATRKCPYEGMSAIQCAMAVLNRDCRPPIPTWLPPAYADLIRACIDKDPSKRPTFADIIQTLDGMP